ncbi:MAG: hypothetical protein INR73_26475 [Williamsia sp.]|nr:hypothetical protein [Williamsia sp.]
MKKILSLVVVLFAAFTAAHAQSTSTASQTVSLTLQNAIDITISSATGTNFLFDDVAKYQSGLTNTNASTLQVKSNRPWAVTVKAAAATFSGPAAPATQMPSTVLGVRLNGGSSFTALSTTAASLTSGARGTSSFNIDYNANPGYSYDAGTYSLSVVYTATQQ